MPDVALRAEFGLPDRLMRQMVEGILDIGVMYTPQLRPGLEVELLMEDELILVSTQRQNQAPSSMIAMSSLTGALNFRRFTPCAFRKPHQHGFDPWPGVRLA